MCGQFSMFNFYCLDEQDVYLQYFFQDDSYFTWEHKYTGVEAGPRQYAAECANHVWLDDMYKTVLEDYSKVACVRPPRLCQCRSLGLTQRKIFIYADESSFYHQNVSKYQVTPPEATYDADRCTVTASCTNGKSLVVFDGPNHFMYGDTEISGICGMGDEKWILDDGIGEATSVDRLNMACVNYSVK